MGYEKHDNWIERVTKMDKKSERERERTWQGSETECRKKILSLHTDKPKTYDVQYGGSDIQLKTRKEITDYISISKTRTKNVYVCS